MRSRKSGSVGSERPARKQVVVRRREEDEEYNPFFEVRIPDQELSETILEFSAPVFLLLPDPPPLDIVRPSMEIVLAIWNTGAMTLPVWETRRSYLKKVHDQFDLLLEQMPPAVRYFHERLYEQRILEPYVHDPRAVDAWAMEDDGKGGFILHCTVRLPTEIWRLHSVRVSFRQCSRLGPLNESQFSNSHGRRATSVALGRTPGSGMAAGGPRGELRKRRFR